MLNDEEIRIKVIDELCHDLKDRNPAAIGVSCKDGIITLSGSVEEDISVVSAGMAAKRVPDIKGVVNEIKVVSPAELQQEDGELARLVASALELNEAIPRERVTITVKDGWVTLGGEVETEEQKKEAEAAAGAVPKIKGLTNEISMQPKLSCSEIKNQIAGAFQHMAEHHAAAINVQLEGSKVTLSGTVRAWVEKVEAECIAKHIPGVQEVDNKLELIPMLQGKETPP